MRTGLDRWRDEGFAAVQGQRIGLVCNQAAVTGDYRHVYDLLLEEHRSGNLTLGAVFGPQHGLYGHTQDNMIEWEPPIDILAGNSWYREAIDAGEPLAWFADRMAAESDAFRPTREAALLYQRARS